MPNKVKDISLAAQGENSIEWARQHMKALLSVQKDFEKRKPLKGTRIGMALHVTKETAVLVEILISGGAQVAITSCNPLSTQDDVAAALAKRGVEVYAYKGETKEDYYSFIRKVVDTQPDITIDDGCDLVSEIHKNRPELIKKIIGGAEETTTGVIRLKAMEKDGALKYPVIAVNDNKTKHLFDNYYGTGQSAIDGVIRATNVLIAGSTVVVSGYGSCGKGVASVAKGMGAHVVVTEVEPVRALQAHMDGHSVMPMEDAAKVGDVFITVTGNKNVIRKEHFPLMKDGAVLANAGHFDAEIDIASLKSLAKSSLRIRPSLDKYTLKNGNSVYLAGEGRLVNLAAAEGHPSIVMSTSFCGQALAAEFLVKNKGKLPSKVITLPEEIDQRIARLQLNAMGVSMDELTAEQKKYLSSWEEGT
ncbi:MAG: adenosylhomocysteinase [Nanoarchaeota archaeon]|nr:MAG: adenosylhomocysteinase [Nanoarchaeota archaeon]